MSIRRSSMAILVGAACWAVGAAMIGTAGAATITEDFAYTAGSLGGQSGGAGWSTAWSTATTRIDVHPGSLAYSGGGYNITQNDTSKRRGRREDRRRVLPTARPDARPHRHVRTVWFSYLTTNTNASSGASMAIQWNPTTANGALSDNYVQLTGTQVNVNYGGTLSTAVVTGLAESETHLVLGRWIIGAGNDSLDLWVDPSDLTNLGTADFSASSADALGGSLTRIGVGSQGSGTSSGTSGPPLGGRDGRRTAGQQ